MRRLGILLTIGSLTQLAACGGGGGSSGGGSAQGVPSVTPTQTQTATPTPTGSASGVTSVTASCSPSSVLSGQTSQCAAIVTGTGSFSSTVNWSTSAGQISSSGLLTAPIVSGTTSVMVTATATEDPTKSGTATETVTPTGLANNVAPLVVDAGPASLQFLSTNLPFVTITICVPGTNACQTIDHVLVDTGSYGLRIVSSVLTIPLPQETDSSGDPLNECMVFLDGYVWGPVATADVTVAGEKAVSVPLQIMIPSSSSPPVPKSCSSQSTAGNEGGTVNGFGANALLGVGVFQQDCGLGCTSQSSGTSPPPGYYYGCAASGCSPTSVPLAQQVANPVAMFPADNNGVLIQLPSVPDGGAQQMDGFLIFGIGTQSNNGLGSSTIYPVPDSGSDAGSFTTIFKGTSYTGSFIDSGSNALFFLDSATTGIATCANPNAAWYCPATSPDRLTAVNQGSNGQSGPTTTFSIENANDLFSTSNIAFSTLGGPNPGFVDWGLSFFFGRNVFTAIEHMSTPGGVGPYYAYNLP